jgi:acylphosphatase
LGITGWVRNMPNGTVETVAVGDQKKLEYFFAWLHHGPSAATVTQVDADWDNTSPKFAAFEIQHDAK